MPRRLDEFEIIARYFKPLAAGYAGALGLSDDAASLRIGEGRELIVTADALVAGVHFLPRDPPDLVARKMLRVNLSDLAAKGATPTVYFMTLALGPEVIVDQGRIDPGLGGHLAGGDAVEAVPREQPLGGVQDGLAHVDAGGFRRPPPPVLAWPAPCRGHGEHR